MITKRNKNKTSECHLFSLIRVNNGFWEWFVGSGKLHISVILLSPSAKCSSAVRAFAHGASDQSFMVDPLSYFSFQPVFHESFLLIGKSSPCGSSRFPFSLSEWSFTICLTSYNRKLNVLSTSLNKIFPSFSLTHVAY